MQIQLNSDKNVDVSAGMVERIKADLDSALSRFSEHITRVEVHLGDVMAGRSDGADVRCMIEARPAGQSPVAVTNYAASVDQSLSGAISKLESLLQSKFERSDQRKGADSIRHLEVREELS